MPLLVIEKYGPIGPAYNSATPVACFMAPGIYLPASPHPPQAQGAYPAALIQLGQALPPSIHIIPSLATYMGGKINFSPTFQPKQKDSLTSLKPTSES